MLNNRHRQVLYDKKWKKFLRRAWLFRHIPFVEFALGAGSMATGDVVMDSDFDVIIGARRGRIFTARFFAAFAFGVFGWRRARRARGAAASDKICLNHFVTDKAFRLAGPHTESWRELYKNLVPIYGQIESIRDFFVANADWMGEARKFADDLRYRYPEPSSAKNFLETILFGVVLF